MDIHERVRWENNSPIWLACDVCDRRFKLVGTADGSRRRADAGRQRRIAAVPAIFDVKVLPVDPAEPAKLLHKRHSIRLVWLIRFNTIHKHADALLLLRTRRERPRSSRAAEKGDEFAPSHVPQASD